MKLVRVYSDDSGATHIDEVGDVLQERLSGRPLERADTAQWDEVPASGLSFRRVDADALVPGFHRAPVRICLLLLGGGFEVEVASGATSRVGPGDALLLEDLTGEGHISRGIAEVAVVRLP